MKIFVQVTPSVKKESVTQQDETHFEVHVREPARQGRANKAVAQALSGYLGKKARLVSGFSSRKKVFEIL